MTAWKKNIDTAPKDRPFLFKLEGDDVVYQGQWFDMDKDQNDNDMSYYGWSDELHDGIDALLRPDREMGSWCEIPK